MFAMLEAQRRQEGTCSFSRVNGLAFLRASLALQRRFGEPLMCPQADILR